MLKREDLNGKTLQDVQKLLENEVADYKVNAETYTEEEALQQEQELMQVMNEYDGYLRTVTYELGEQCEFDGQVFNKKTVSDFIVDIINNQELEWSYTLGMYDMVKLWKNKDLKEVNYHAYDSTLRTLGQCKYKGFENWRKILAINSWLSGCHDEYVMDTNYMIYLSQLHNVLIDVIKKFNPGVEEVE